MDYEEKKQARIDRLHAKTQKLEEESRALFESGDKMLNAIPMGQPLVSQSLRSYHARAVSKIDRSMEIREKAEYYRQKAEAMEKNTAIYSDDPNAITKLQEKLAQCEAKQEYMKAANRYYRKNGTMLGYEEIKDEEAGQLDQNIRDDYSRENIPYPSYKLSYNNANIRRLRERIKSLSQNMKFVGWEFSDGKAVANTEIMRLQLIFDERPDEEKRCILKQNGFRWSPSEGAWQRQLNNTAIYAAGRIDFIRPLSGDSPFQLQTKAVRSQGDSR